MARLPIPAKVVARAMPVAGSTSTGFADAANILASGLDTALQADRAADAQLDQMAHAQAMDQKRMDDQALYLKVQAEQARMRAQQTIEIKDYQSTAAPGGDGHTQNVRDILQRDTALLDEMIGDNETVRQMVVSDTVSWNARTEASAMIWQDDQMLKFQGQNLEVYSTESSNALRLAPTTETAVDTFAQNRKIVDALNVNDDQKNEILRKMNMGTMGAYLEGMFQNGQWEGAAKVIESGVFNAYIDDVSPWMNRIHNEQEQAAQRAEREASMAREGARNNLKLVREKLDAGVYVPPAEIEKAIAAGKAAGIPDHELYPYGVAAVQSETNKAFADATPAQIQARRDELKVKIDAGKASESEQVEYQQLGGLYDGAVSRSAKEQQALIDKGPDGVPEILTRTNTGNVGFDYQTREAISPGLGHIGLLSPSIQQQVVAGEKAMEADSTLKPKEAPKYFSAETASVRRGFGDLAGVERAATAYYANTLVKSGQRGWHPKAYKVSVTAASGGVYDSGADQWLGGIQWNTRENTKAYSVWLPDNWTMPEFRSSVGSQSWLDQAGAVYDDGTPARAADIRDHYTPVWTGYQVGKDGTEKRQYHFFDARGRALKTKSGANAAMLVEDR